MKFLGLALLVLSTNALSLESRYPQSLITQAKKAVCESEDSSQSIALADRMHSLVQDQFALEAKNASLSVEDYLNRKETHQAFLVKLTEVSQKEKLEALSQEEFMLLSLEMGLRFQILATVRFPTLSMIDQASDVLQNQWLPRVEEISSNPQGCASAAVNSSERSSSDKPSAPGATSPSQAPGAVSN